MPITNLEFKGEIPAGPQPVTTITMLQAIRFRTLSQCHSAAVASRFFVGFKMTAERLKQCPLRGGGKVWTHENKGRIWVIAISELTQLLSDKTGRTISSGQFIIHRGEGETTRP
jgi:hypothetical protein